MSFTPLASDSCIYIQREGDHVTFIALYVDDLLIFSDCMKRLTSVKTELSRRFEMTDLGDTQFILGIQVTRDRTNRTISLSQSDYVRRLLERYGYTNCKTSFTPMEHGLQLTKADCPIPTPSHQMTLNGHAYSSVVGALMYAMLGTRPDLAYAMGMLSRFNNNPGQSHWVALKRVLRYLRTTIDRKLTYGTVGASGSKLSVKGYCDADWGGSIDDRRSITGWVFLVAGGAISWKAQKQHTVALSSVEAEYMAASLATREAMWIRSMLQELGLTSTNPLSILTDSQGSMALAKNPEHHQRSKHIDIRHHFIREQVAMRIIELTYISTEQMAADQLTKPLTQVQHERCIRSMGLQWE
jgi:hypothetical protein